MADLRLPERCHYCDAPPIVLCDFVTVPAAASAAEAARAATTCDRALCATHRRKLGHTCTRLRSKSDTIDVCFLHGDALGERRRPDQVGVVPSRFGLVEVGARDLPAVRARATWLVAAHSHDTVHGPTLGTEVGLSDHRHKMPGHAPGEGMWTLWAPNDDVHHHLVCVGPTGPARASNENQRRYVR